VRALKELDVQEWVSSTFSLEQLRNIQYQLMTSPLDTPELLLTLNLLETQLSQQTLSEERREQVFGRVASILARSSSPLVLAACGRISTWFLQYDTLSAELLTYIASGEYELNLGSGGPSHGPPCDLLLTMSRLLLRNCNLRQIDQPSRNSYNGIRDSIAARVDGVLERGMAHVVPDSREFILQDRPFLSIGIQFGWAFFSSLAKVQRHFQGSSPNTSGVVLKAFFGGVTALTADIFEDERAQSSVFTFLSVLCGLLVFAEPSRMQACLQESTEEGFDGTKKDLYVGKHGQDSLDLRESRGPRDPRCPWYSVRTASPAGGLFHAVDSRAAESPNGTSANVSVVLLEDPAGSSQHSSDKRRLVTLNQEAFSQDKGVEPSAFLSIVGLVDLIFRVFPGFSLPQYSSEELTRVVSNLINAAQKELCTLLNFLAAEEAGISRVRPETGTLEVLLRMISRCIQFNSGFSVLWNQAQPCIQDVLSFLSLLTEDTRILFIGGELYSESSYQNDMVPFGLTKETCRLVCTLCASLSAELSTDADDQEFARTTRVSGDSQLASCLEQLLEIVLNLAPNLAVSPDSDPDYAECLVQTSCAFDLLAISLGSRPDITEGIFATPACWEESQSPSQVAPHIITRKLICLASWLVQNVSAQSLSRGGKIVVPDHTIEGPGEFNEQLFNFCALSLYHCSLLLREIICGRFSPLPADLAPLLSELLVASVSDEMCDLHISQMFLDVLVSILSEIAEELPVGQLCPLLNASLICLEHEVSGPGQSCPTGSRELREEDNMAKPAFGEPGAEDSPNNRLEDVFGLVDYLSGRVLEVIDDFAAQGVSDLPGSLVESSRNLLNTLSECLLSGDRKLTAIRGQIMQRLLAVLGRSRDSLRMLLTGFLPRPRDCLTILAAAVGDPTLRSTCDLHILGEVAILGIRSHGSECGAESLAEAGSAETAKKPWTDFVSQEDLAGIRACLGALLEVFRASPPPENLMELRRMTLLLQFFVVLSLGLDVPKRSAWLFPASFDGMLCYDVLAGLASLSATVRPTAPPEGLDPQVLCQLLLFDPSLPLEGLRSSRDSMEAGCAKTAFKLAAALLMIGFQDDGQEILLGLADDQGAMASLISLMDPESQDAQLALVADLAGARVRDMADHLRASDSRGKANDAFSQPPVVHSLVSSAAAACMCMDSTVLDLYEDSIVCALTAAIWGLSFCQTRERRDSAQRRRHIPRASNLARRSAALSSNELSDISLNSGSVSVLSDALHVRGSANPTIEETEEYVRRYGPLRGECLQRLMSFAFRMLELSTKVCSDRMILALSEALRSSMRSDLVDSAAGNAAAVLTLLRALTLKNPEACAAAVQKTDLFQLCAELTIVCVRKLSALPYTPPAWVPKFTSFSFQEALLGRMGLRAVGEGEPQNIYQQQRQQILDTAFLGLQLMLQLVRACLPQRQGEVTPCSLEDLFDRPAETGPAASERVARPPRGVSTCDMFVAACMSFLNDILMSSDVALLADVPGPEEAGEAIVNISLEVVEAFSFILASSLKTSLEETISSVCLSTTYSVMFDFLSSLFEAFRLNREPVKEATAVLRQELPVYLCSLATKHFLTMRQVEQLRTIRSLCAFARNILCASRDGDREAFAKRSARFCRALFHLLDVPFPPRLSPVIYLHVLDAFAQLGRTESGSKFLASSHLMFSLLSLTTPQPEAGLRAAVADGVLLEFSPQLVEPALRVILAMCETEAGVAAVETSAVALSQVFSVAEGAEGPEAVLALQILQKVLADRQGVLEATIRLTEVRAPRRLAGLASTLYERAQRKDGQRPVALLAEILSQLQQMSSWLGDDNWLRCTTVLKDTVAACLPFFIRLQGQGSGESPPLYTPQVSALLHGVDGDM